MPKPKHPPAPAAESHHNEEQQLGLERLIFFSDAVFAIAITLLALEIRLPEVESPLTDAGLAQALLDLWPKYLSYVISFLVIGWFWLVHHRKFQLIKRYDRGLLFINLLLLLVIAFIPFPTAVISDYGNRTATIFYALVIALAGLFSVGVWWYAAYQHRLIDPHLDAAVLRRQNWNPLVVPIIFLLSIGVAFIDADLAKFSWLLVAVASFVVR